MPGVVRWNPYKVGELRDQILRELNAIASGKDYRRKKGLEAGAIREVKSNPHWQLYATIELFEMFSKRVDDVFKNTYIGTMQNLNESSNNLRGLAQQLQNAEYNINNTSTLAANNIIKGLKGEAARMTKLQQSLTKMGADSKKHTDAISSDLRKVASLFKTTITQKFDALKGEIQDDFGNMSRDLTEEVKNISEQVGNTSNTIDDMGTKMENFREITTNVLDEHQTHLASELKDSMEALNTRNEESVGEMSKNLEDAVTNLTSLFNSTNEHLDKVSESVMKKMDDTTEDSKKELQREVSELRTSLSTVRSDIELMKSVLTKLDGKK